MTNSKINQNFENFKHEGIFKTLKGFPATPPENVLYNLKNEEVSLPCATLKMSAVENNIAWMQAFANKYKILLAPHGKTSLTPAIISKQVEAGAWGMTMATIHQAYVAYQQGAKNIILANQLIGKTNFELAFQLIKNNDVNLLVCIDSIDNALALNDYFSQKNQTLNVLIEIGVMGGRCGVRSTEELDKLIQFVRCCDHLSLQGIEFYEGVIHGENEEDQVRAFLKSVQILAIELNETNQFDTKTPIITGAGSAWYDLVTEMLMDLPIEFQKVIRPGCYVSHDKGIYGVAQSKVMERISRSEYLSQDIDNDLISAIEVWVYVQSRPEKNKVIVNVGKRDVAFDTDLPTVERAFRDGKLLDLGCSDMTTTDVMDQHMFLKVEENCPLKVGDVLVLSTSHPCITFDKWRYIGLTDDNDNVLGWMKTEF